MPGEQVCHRRNECRSAGRMMPVYFNWKQMLGPDLYRSGEMPYGEQDGEEDHL